MGLPQGPGSHVQGQRTLSASLKELPCEVDAEGDGSQPDLWTSELTMRVHGRGKLMPQLCGGHQQRLPALLPPSPHLESLDPPHLKRIILRQKTRGSGNYVCAFYTKGNCEYGLHSIFDIIVTDMTTARG